MMHLEKSDIMRYIDTLERWLHSGTIDKPNLGQINAINAAVVVMQDSSRKWDYEKAIAILSYHINQPLAHLFRDPVTIKAIKAGIHALNRKLEEKEGRA